jgi:four helix bundle protein
MFLKLNHQKLDIYSISKSFVEECYRLTKQLPESEKFGMISQIHRAALSVHLNIAEGASRKSETERKRFYEVARGSVIEIDAALDIANELNFIRSVDYQQLEELLVRCFKILTGLIKSKLTIHHSPLTIHENLI